MPQLRIEVFQEYQFGPRSILTPGERFRVSGGPVYVTDDGRRIPMFERGIFTFLRLCVRGSARWIEARRSDGSTAVLWVGKACRSRTVPNLRRRPYRITKKISGAQEPSHAKGKAKNKTRQRAAGVVVRAQRRCRNALGD